MQNQKHEIIQFVLEQKAQGRSISSSLTALGVSSSNYYRWQKPCDPKTNHKQKTLPLTPIEKQIIEETKDANPSLRHRQIQGIIQGKGIYLSASSVYNHLKSINLVEYFKRREAPWKSPRYNVIKKNVVWGGDWTKLRIAGIRWHLITLIDFFSRLIIAFDIVPNVNAAHIKLIYKNGLKAQNINLKSLNKPETRLDRGSPNTSHVTKAFFDEMGAELSFARVHRPTDNAITERFYGTVKQEEIYLVGNYPDELSAREEIGRYIEYYNNERPHQTLWNFTPAEVHETNNNTDMLLKLKNLKMESRIRRKEYWSEQDKLDLLNYKLLSHLEKT